MTLFDLVWDLAQYHVKIDGAGYVDGLTFDFKEKSIRSKGKYIYKDGSVVPQILKIGEDKIELDAGMKPIDECENAYEMFLWLHHIYKYSRPNSYSLCTKHNFLAVQEDKLSNYYMMYGEDREWARCILEAFVLLTDFPWEDEKKWYWLSPDKDAILYREWAVN